jgi:hypothetical protein
MANHQGKHLVETDEQSRHPQAVGHHRTDSALGLHSEGQGQKHAEQQQAPKDPHIVTQIVDSPEGEQVPGEAQYKAHAQAHQTWGRHKATEDAV